MTRKILVVSACLGLGTIVLASSPLLAQFMPGQPGPCQSPPQFKPVVSKYPGLKPFSAASAKPPVEPVTKTSAEKPAKPQAVSPNLSINSSGPLPPFPGVPDPATEPPTTNDPELPLVPVPPVEGSKTEVKPPPSVPKELNPGLPKEEPPMKLVPLPPLVIDPPSKPEVKVEVKKEVPLVIPTPLPPVIDHLPAGPPQKPNLPPIVPPTNDLLLKPIGPWAPEIPPLEPIKPAPAPIKPIEFTLPAGKQSSPWVIRVEVIKTVTHLTAASKNAEFHVHCQNLKVQSPTGDIQAEGQIKVSAAGLDMNCEKLVISWQNDWVMMEGKVRLQTEKGAQHLELIGDKLQLKLTTLTSTSALKSLQPLLYQAAYPPVADKGEEGKQVFPTPGAPASALPKVEPLYKRVTEGD